MDESLIYELQSYLPIKLEDPSISDYISYHIQELSKSIENNIDSGIFLHTHIIYMTFIYIQLLRISQNKQEEFKYSWIGFPREESVFLENTNSPFSFSEIKERTVFRFFRLIDFDDTTISELKKCIDERNELFHATGEKIMDLDKKIEKYLKNMEMIVKKSEKFLRGLFTGFLESNLFSEGYEIMHDDLELNLYIPYQFSEQELKLLINGNYNKISNAIKNDLGFAEDEIVPNYSKQIKGKSSFDYSSNNGIIKLGEDRQVFELKFSKASDVSIHVYNDPKNIESIALANGVSEISEITNATIYDTSSRARTLQEGEIVILKNIYGNYCAVKILDVKDRTRKDDKDEVTFEYVINPAGDIDFSK